jgi:glycosyltransferase involved in cell wall biosynthesis
LDVITVPLDRARGTFDPRRQLGFFAHLPRDVWAIRDVIRRRGIDVVQVGGLVNPQGAFAARLEGVPVIWQLLDTHAPMSVRRVFMPLVLRLADVVMTTGHGVATMHPGAARLGDRLRVFYPPVVLDRFDPENVDRAAARAEFGFAPHDSVLGTVGNLNPQKGHEYLLRAAAAARARRATVKVLLVGSSHDTHRSYERELYKLCRSLELSVGSDVVFAGGLDDVRPALAAMDVFVLSSPGSEGAPTAIEEAMMMSLPVVATDVGSVREVVDHGTTGFVVPPRDPYALAESVLRVLDNPRMGEQFGSRARQQAVARFSAEECARVHVDAYESALARRARRAPAEAGA